MSTDAATLPFAGRRDLSWLKHVALVFVLSRVLMLGIFALVPMIANITPDAWHQGKVSIRVGPSDVVEGVRRVAHANDAGWYLGLARDGYEARPFDTSRQANWAFFPLHPMLWKASAAVTGEWFWSGVLVANAFFFAGLCLLWQLARTLMASAQAADDAVLFAAFWPTSYFASLPHTEGLFFCLVTLSLLAAVRGKWWMVAVTGMFAGATRLNGLFLLPAAFMKWRRGEGSPVDLAKLALIGVGLAGFMLYLWQVTGNPLAFKDIQVTWGREFHAPWSALFDYLGRPHRLVTNWNPVILNFSMTVLALLSVATCWKKGWHGLATFTALTLLAPLCTGTLMSMTRYIGVAPGIYLAFAVWSQGHRRRGQLLLVSLAVAMTLLCTLFAAGVNIGGA